MSDPDARALAALVETATIVGLGTSTREAHETFRLVEQTTHALIQHGFRVVALHDNERVCDRYDRFVRGGDVDLDPALRQAWGPWRTTEMRDAVHRIHRHNAHHPEDPVRVVGIAGSRTLPADYDRVLALLAPLDQPTAHRVAELFAVIRTAHDSGEHGAAMVAADGVSATDFATRAAPFLAAMTGSLAGSAAVIDAGNYAGEGQQSLEFTRVALETIMQASRDQGVSTKVLRPIHHLVHRQIAAGRGTQGSDRIFEELRRPR